MSLEFAAQLANFAADELVSTRKELREVNTRYEKLYNDHENLKYDHENLQQAHENLKEAMIEMEKKMSALLSSQQEQSPEHILHEIEDEWSKETPDHDKIKMLNDKYDAVCRM